MQISPQARFLLRVSCFLPIALVLIAGNWIYSQPFVQRRISDGLREITDGLLAGETVWTNQNIRVLKRAWIQRLPQKDILVLGSSRTLAIEERWFRPASLFNTGVLGGDLYDAIAMFEICLESGQKPRTVILEIKPVLAQMDPPESAVAPYFRRAITRLGLTPSARAYSDLFSLQQFRSNFRRVRHPSRGLWLHPVPQAVPVRPDGSVVLSYDPTPEAVAARLRATLADPQQLGRGGESGLEPANLRILQRFLDDLKARGIQVIVYLGPVHPLVYAAFVKDGRYDEAWIRREAASRGMAVVGAFAPMKVNATPADFLDDIHPRAELVERIFREAGILESR
jgi:hypothetical protein